MVRQGCECELKTGFACWGPAGCWHIWIEDTEGVQYDLGQSLSGITVTLLSELPEGSENIGTGEGEDEYKVYLEDPKAYWTMKRSSSAP